MVSRRFFGQHGDRRQNARHIAGQEDDGIRLACQVFCNALLNVLQRVGSTRVLSQAVVGVIRLATVVEYDVFQHGAKLDRIPDDRLVLLRKVDALGVAAAFHVEDNAVAPSVFVITNQEARLVSRQRGFAGAREAEEQAGFTIFAHVSRAVHRQHVGSGQQEVLHREHGFLHFAGVAHASDQHFTLGKVDDDAAIGVGAVAVRVTLEACGVKNGPLFFSGLVVGLRTYKHGATK